MKSKVYKWGILGAGKIAGKFSEDLARVPGAELHAVASRDHSRATDFAEKLGYKKSFGSYRELAEDEETDIIYIATPHVFHCEHTLLCLQNKKAVLCEKPFAMNLAQVEEMITAARKNNAFLMEGMWTAFLPHFQYIQELVDSKKYGALQELKANFGFAAPFLPEKRLYNKSLGGGSLLDIGIYPVFAALSLLGGPDTITASAKIGETGVDEICNIKFRYPTGALAILESSIIKNTPTIATLQFEKATVLIKDRFHEPTSIVVTNKDKDEDEEITFDVNTRGYYYEAVHVQQMLDASRIESTVMTWKRSRELMGMLDEIREKIGLVY